MMDLDVTFEDTPWETLLKGMEPGGSVSAVSLLAALEGEDEDQLENAFQAMEDAEISLDISGIPKYRGEGQAAQRLHMEQQLAASGLNPGELEPGDPLRIYLEEVAGISDAGDEEALAARSARGDESAMLSLTNLGLSRVVELAKEYVGYGVLLQDMIQEGSLGLWLAISSYREGSYAHFRDDRIRTAIAKAVTRQAKISGVGEKLRKRMEAFEVSDKRLLRELGRSATLEEIAQDMGITLEEAAAVGKMISDAKLQQKSVQSPQEPEEGQRVEDTAYFQMRQRISELLSSLSDSDAKLLSLRYGLDRELPLSPEETAARMGFTVSQVLSREASALEKLRLGS